MKTLLNVALTILISFSFSGCMAWPSIAALLFGKSKKKNTLLLLPPSSNSGSPQQDKPADNSNNQTNIPNTATSTATTTSTGTTTNSTTSTSTSTAQTKKSIVNSIGTTAISGSYTVGSMIDIEVNFDYPVDVTGNPSLLLNNAAKATYFSGSGTNKIIFRYQVNTLEDIAKLDYNSSFALSSIATSLKSNGYELDLTLPEVGATGSISSKKSITIDTISPTLSTKTDAVTSTPSTGAYTINDTIEIKVKFSEPIYVDTTNGTPQIELDTIPTIAYATYASGSGSDTLSFIYKVAANQNTSDLNYAGTNSFMLNNAIITDSAGNPADLNLPAKLNLGSLGSNSDVMVDTNPTVSISVDSPTIDEGASGTTTLTFTVTLSSSSYNTITVDYATTDNTTLAGSDYTATNGTLTFSPNQTSKTISITVNSDTMKEADETLYLNLSNPNNANIGSSQGVGTIRNDDSTPTLTVSSPSIIEGTGGTNTISFTVSLSNPTDQNVTFSYTTANGSATVGSDYTLTSGTSSISAGQTTTTISVPITTDTSKENNETFALNLTGITSTTNVAASGTAAIQDDDSIVVSIIPPANPVNEGTILGDNNTLDFTMQLSATSVDTIVVTYSTEDGTALSSDGDYTSVTNQNITFAPGDSTKTISIAITRDNKYESNETLKVKLISATNANLSITNNTATGTIKNDDNQPTVFINPPIANVNEKNTAPSATLDYTIQLSNSSDQTITVTYSTEDGTALSSDNDYTVITNQTVTFNPGQTTKVVSVTITPDSKDENDETVKVKLISATNADVSTTNNIAIGTIADDDDPPTISINSPIAVTEGNTGTTPITFTVTLDAASGKTITVNYATADGTATTANSDYSSTTGTLTFAPGDLNKTFTVNINGDYVEELVENFVVNLSTPINVAIATSQGTATINNDDTAGVTLSKTTAAVTEGSATTDSYTIVLNSKPTANVVVSFTTDTTYGIQAISNITFTPTDWNVAQPITVSAVNDSSDEGTHTSNVTHSASSSDTKYSGITIPAVTTTITDNDTAGVTLSKTTAAVTEGSATTDSYTIVLNSKPTANVVVSFTTDTTYGIQAISNITFTPTDWNVAQPITVSAVNDSSDEGTHTSNVTHSASSSDTKYSGITIPAVTATITDNDTAGVTLSKTTAAVTEGSATTDSYTIVLNSKPTADVVVSFTTDTTYGIQAISNITFTPTDWNVAQPITVSAVNDNSDEGTHTSNVTHSASSSDTKYSGITIPAVTATITDNDTSGATLSKTTAAVTEGSVSDTYTIVLNSKPTADVTISFTTGTQINGIANIIFTASNWNAPQTISVSAVNDALIEGNHNQIITHTSASSDAKYNGITISTVTTTITDNDTAGVTISKTTAVVTEGGSGDSYTIQLNAQPDNDVTISFNVGTANGLQSISNITFTTTNWNSPKTITISAVDDSIKEAAPQTRTIAHTSSSTDAHFNSLTISSVDVTITDNDNTGVTIVQSGGSTDVAENGTTDSYTIVLNSEPTADVTISFSTGTQINGIANIIFTTSNWSNPRTINVTATNDSSVEGNHTQVISHTATSSDTNYNNISIASVTTNIADNDSAGVSITQTGGTTNITEGGATDTYSIVLTSAPSNDVTISFNTGSQVNAIGSITFTSGNWGTPRDITITATDDNSVEGAHTQVISHTATSSDTNYDNISITSVTANIVDNDTASVTITETGGTTNVTEGGATDTYSLVLTSKPTADVVISFTTETTYGVQVISNITFTPTNWSVAQDVTVTAVNDNKYEGATPHTSTISHTVTSGDTNYNGKAVSNVVANITDNDSQPTVQFALSTSNSGADEEATGNHTIELTLSNPSSEAISVKVYDVTTTGTGYAVSGTDYSAIGSPLTVNFAAGSTSQTVTIAVLQDLFFEGDEKINLSIALPTNAGLGIQTTHEFTIKDDDVGVDSATTMDVNNDGKIDYLKVIFKEAINDSTFPGYKLNALGDPQTKWLIAGYSDVVLAHGTAAPESDGVNDTTIYLKFTPSTLYDTGAKPDLTTTAAPDLLAVSGKAVGQVFTAQVAEADGAKPIVVSATGNTTSNRLTVTFSEAVYTTNATLACGLGGNLDSSDITFADSNTVGATSITGMDSSDTCASDTGFNAIFVTDYNFVSGDGDGTAPDDTVAASTTVYDASKNPGNPIAKAISVISGPRITSIEQYDTNKNGKIDQVKVTFSMSMDDSTIDDADAFRFTVGGFNLSKVDSGTSGTGTIASPNTDPATANDTIVTLFTDDTSLSGTSSKTMTFTTNTGRWMASGLALQSSTDLTSVTIDKAPPVILTAVASDNTTSLTGVDSDDTLVITFSEPTNKPAITSANITSILSLSSSHVWGNITTAVWNANGDVLTLTFAGSGGSTVAVGDTITILGTIADTAPTPNVSTNIPSVNPISGTFFTDTIPPYLVSAYNITPNSVTVRYSEAVLMDGSANAANLLSNYVLAEDPSNACNNVTVASLTVVADNTVQLNLTGGQPGLCDIQYKVTVSNVKDLSGNTIGTPNYLTFIGNERLKVVSAVPLTTTTFKLNFNKPLKAGNDIAGSAGCTTSTQCGYRYYIHPSLGNITSATVGTGTLANVVTLTHSAPQNGTAYTVIVANNVDSDGFNNTSWGSIRNDADSENLQIAPFDRASFIGLGTPISCIGCGSFFTDPFYDGTSFSFVFNYGGRVYLGTNDKNTAAFRFDPNGSNPITVNFKFSSGSCSSSITFGYSTGASCGTNQGPNGERGVVGFTSGIATIGGTNYEMLMAGPLEDGVGNSYFTQDLDTMLDWRSFTLAPYTAGGNTKSVQTLYVKDNNLYSCLASDHGTQAPICGYYSLSASGGLVNVGSGSNMDSQNFPYLGRKGSPANPAASSGGNDGVIGIDSIVIYKGYLYMANNGGILYSSNLSSFASPTLSTPTGFAGTTLVLPPSPAGLEKVGLGQRGIAVLREYNNKLYMVRNVATGSSYSNQSTSLRGEVWKCTPTTTGNASTCDPGDWVKIISGTESELKTSTTVTATSISLFQNNGNDTMYIGFNDATSGVRVFRLESTDIPASNGTTLSSAGWIQQGTNGLGTVSPLYTQIYSSTSISDGAVDYIYFTAGTGIGGASIKVFRQLDNALGSGSAFNITKHPLEDSILLAFLDKDFKARPAALAVLTFVIAAMILVYRLSHKKEIGKK